MYSYGQEPIYVAWYREEDYPRILRIMEDRHLMMASFSKWLAAAEKFEKSSKGQGFDVVRVIIDPVRFVAWCRKHSLSCNARARVKYKNDPANWKTPSGTDISAEPADAAGTGRRRSAADQRRASA
jgi:hypothetical protein